MVNFKFKDSHFIYKNSFNFRIFDDTQTFDRAKKECENYGGTLATIESQEVKDYIAKRSVKGLVRNGLLK